MFGTSIECNLNSLSRMAAHMAAADGRIIPDALEAGFYLFRRHQSYVVAELKIRGLQFMSI
jgi:hypothetical protein